MPVIVAVVGVVAACIAVNLVFVAHPQLERFNQFCWIAGPALALATIHLYLFNNRFRSLLSVDKPAQYYLEGWILDSATDSGGTRIPESAVRPEVYGEGRNARIDVARTTDDTLVIVPLRRLDVVATTFFIAISTILICTACIAYVDPSNPEYLQLLPESELLRFFTSIHVGFKPFIFLFGLVALFFPMSFLRRKQRKIYFVKSLNRCVVQHSYAFGLLAEADTPYAINTVKAVQLISYSDRDAINKYRHKTDRKGNWRSSKTPIPEYEINLVHLQGARVNIVNHRSKRAIRRDADTLAEWLGVPLIGSASASPRG